MSQPRCKPGDLAVVISARSTANIGRIVQIIKPDDGTHDLSFPHDQVAWIVEAHKPMTWLLNKQRIRRKRGPVPDAQLQPIRGLRPGLDIADSLSGWTEVPPKEEQLPQKGTPC